MGVTGGGLGDEGRETEPGGARWVPPERRPVDVAVAERDVTVVIVSYNTRDLILDALESLPPDVPVVVVDNASTDGSADAIAERFPNVRLVRNERNRGFGAANNQGVDLADTGLVLLMNSDCRACSGAVDILASCFVDPGVVAAGGRLMHPDGRLQESAASRLTLWAVLCEQLYLEKLFPGSRLFSPYWQSGRLAERAGTHPVAQVMGACLMVRPVERFDERFFLYCEDTELCHRLSRHGTILYVPEARFTHRLGASSQSSRWSAVARYNRGKELYFALHGGPLSCGACWCLNRLGALLRLIAWGLGSPFGAKYRNQALLFAKVLFAPLRGPALPPDA